MTVPTFGKRLERALDGELDFLNEAQSAQKACAKCGAAKPSWIPRQQGDNMWVPM